ncbi:hypothetical protein ACCQ14_01810 [Xanthomonas sp. NCPPB 2865]|jgi:hypothetical protein|uniref:hypothetical protein n=1 Tax=unclassified Xanthomonas TaxID=2643310 RepID=UPI001CF82CDA|nr:hypothetical protein [Xanthomonas sp. MWU16-30325]
MIDQRKADCLYEMAREMASQTPEIGSKLAGNCVTVHFGMLGTARQFFGQTVEFVIGHIEMGGEERFHFTEKEVADWRSGAMKPRYNLHAWLAVGADLIDLTLAPTIHEIEPNLLQPHLTYIDCEIAAEHGIVYVQRLKGDNVPLELGLLR